MMSDLKALSGWILRFALMLLLVFIGCSPKIVTKNAPPSPSGLSQAIGSGTITFYRWDDQPTVMICSDIQGGSKSLNDYFTSVPPTRIHKSDGHLTSQDDRKLEWRLEKKDGDKCKCRLNDKDFDLDEGILFLVKTKGGETEIEQISRDLSDVKLDAESVNAFARKDSVVSKFLEIGEE